MKPGIYQGLPMAEYLSMPAVSASLLKVIVTQCPLAAWHESWLNPKPPEDDSTSESDAGSIAHGILLEGSTAGVEVIDPRDHPAEKTGNIPDGWTNKSIKAARDAAREAGKIPVLEPAMRTINAMVDAAREYLESVKKHEPAVWRAFQPRGGEAESTIVWQDGDTLCKIRPDRLSADRKLIVDYKTGKTTSEPDTWGRTQMIRMGYYVSAAFYRRGCMGYFGVEPEYVFLTQQQEPPYLCSLVGVDAHGFDLGTQKIKHGLALWRKCFAANSWPGYPTRVCYPEIPTWEDAAWEGRQIQDLEAHGIVYDPEKLFGGIER